MKVTVKKPVTINIKTIRIIVAVRYGDEDMPFDFPFRNDDTWDISVDVDTGKIMDWPQGVEYDLHMKVCDCGSYWLYDENGEQVGANGEDYAPNTIVPGSYGDYIEMKIAADGTITNWPKKPRVSAFFRD